MCAVGYLGWSIHNAPDTVVETLIRRIDQPEPWHTYAANIFFRADVDTSRRFIDLYFKLRHQGEIPLVHPPFGSNSGMYFLYDIPEKQAGWAVEILEDWLITYIKESLHRL